MNRLNWLIAAAGVGGSMGVDAVPAGDSLEGGLIKAALSTGLIGIMLVWFVLESKRNYKRERAEAATREKRLAERLNAIEDEMREKLVGTLTAAMNTLTEFQKVAEGCRRRVAANHDLVTGQLPRGDK